MNKFILSLFLEHEGNKALRLGKYKLVSTWKDEKETDWELYDMEKDRTEMNNLAATMPEIVNKMSRITMRGPNKNHVLSYHEFRKLQVAKRKAGKQNVEEYHILKDRPDSKNIISCFG